MDSLILIWMGGGLNGSTWTVSSGYVCWPSGTRWPHFNWIHCQTICAECRHWVCSFSFSISSSTYNTIQVLHAVPHFIIHLHIHLHHSVSVICQDNAWYHKKNDPAYCFRYNEWLWNFWNYQFYTLIDETMIHSMLCSRYQARRWQWSKHAQNVEFLKLTKQLMKKFRLK